MTHYFELQEIVNAVALKPKMISRAVIFTGAGSKAFSAGADLKERKTFI